MFSCCFRIVQMFWTSGWSCVGVRIARFTGVRIRSGPEISCIRVFSAITSCGRCSCSRSLSGSLIISLFFVLIWTLIGTFVNCQSSAISSYVTLQALKFIIPFSYSTPPQYYNSVLSSTYSPPADISELSWSILSYYDIRRIPLKTHAPT